MKKLFIIGDPIRHSLSPPIHNAALKKLNLENIYSYEKKELKRDEIENFIDKIRKGEYLGASVTIPYKEIVIPYLDELTKDANSIHAVNTIYNKKGKVVGHNTDGIGFLKSLNKAGILIENKKIVILGAGGAAKAIAISLTLKDIKKITIVNRTIERGKAIEELVKQNENIKIENGSFVDIKEILKDTDILINATSVGMKGKTEGKTLITEDMMHSKLIVNDIIYKPRKTQLLKEAEIAGARTINGIDMLLFQGAEQFKIFTGKNAPIEIMRKTIHGIIDESNNTKN